MRTYRDFESLPLERLEKQDIGYIPMSLENKDSSSEGFGLSSWVTIKGQKKPRP